MDGGRGNASSSVQFKHWNIFFKDIYRVSLEIVDKETGKVIKHRDLEQAIGGDTQNQNGGQGSGSQHQRIVGASLNINFRLKIHYQMKSDEEESTFGMNSPR